jgi:hypothetical protein
MSAELFGRLRADGFTLRTDGETLWVMGGPRLTAELRDEIAAHKPELMACAAFCHVWTVLTTAGERWKAKRMPADCRDFKAALRAYEVLCLALPVETMGQLEMLAGAA